MHILIFGGTFDPIHLGHLLTARAAMETLQADRLLLVPAALSPHKPTDHSASPAHRLAMCQLPAHEDIAIRVSDVELLRPPPSYTFDTLRTLRQTHPGAEFTLLMGADQLPRLHTWHRIAELTAMTRIAILGRAGFTFDLAALQAGIPSLDASRMSLLATPVVQISATDIRRRVAAGLPIHWMVPPTVESYIREHHLYQPGSA